jgi:hypothetical protein
MELNNNAAAVAKLQTNISRSEMTTTKRRIRTTNDGGRSSILTRSSHLLGSTLGLHPTIFVCVLVPCDMYCPINVIISAISLLYINDNAIVSHEQYWSHG